MELFWYCSCNCCGGSSIVLTHRRLLLQQPPRRATMHAGRHIGAHRSVLLICENGRLPRLGQTGFVRRRFQLAGECRDEPASVSPRGPCNNPASSNQLVTSRRGDVQNQAHCDGHFDDMAFQTTRSRDTSPCPAACDRFGVRHVITSQTASSPFRSRKLSRPLRIKQACSGFSVEPPRTSQKALQSWQSWTDRFYGAVAINYHG